MFQSLDPCLTVQTIAPREGEQTMCLRLEGQLSGDSALVLLRAIEPVFVSPNPPRVKLMMDGIHYMDSTGVGVIVAIVKQMRDRGGTLEIVGLSEVGNELLQILELAGLPEVVSVSRSEGRSPESGKCHES